jgi:hypothetical protein
MALPGDPPLSQRKRPDIVGQARVADREQAGPLSFTPDGLAQRIYGPAARRREVPPAVPARTPMREQDR